MYEASSIKLYVKITLTLTFNHTIIERSTCKVYREIIMYQ